MALVHSANSVAESTIFKPFKGVSLLLQAEARTQPKYGCEYAV